MMKRMVNLVMSAFAKRVAPVIVQAPVAIVFAFLAKVKKVFALV